MYFYSRKPSPALTNPSSGTEAFEGESALPVDQFNASDSSNRRRHRSEFVSKAEAAGDASEGSGTKTKDDMHLELEHKLQPLSSRKLSLTGAAVGESSDWSTKQKV